MTGSTALAPSRLAVSSGFQSSPQDRIGTVELAGRCSEPSGRCRRTFAASPVMAVTIALTSNPPLAEPRRHSSATARRGH